MKGGVCPVHKTELVGFGTLIFCRECDAELEEEDKVPYSSDTIDLPIIEDDEDTLDLDLETVGYIVTLHEVKLGIMTLSPSDNIRLKKPDLGSTNGFVYKIYMKDIEYSITADGKMAYPTGVYQGVVLERV